MDSFISTMETNALMGKNVARLIVDDMLGKSSGNGVGENNVVSGHGSHQESAKGRGTAREVPKTRPTEPVYKDL